MAQRFVKILNKENVFFFQLPNKGQSVPNLKKYFFRSVIKSVNSCFEERAKYFNMRWNLNGLLDG